MKRNKLNFALTLVAVLTLTSCTIGFENPFVIESESTNSSEVYAKGKSYFQNMMSNKGMETMPSIGDSKIVVVPIVFGNDQSISDNTAVGQKIKTDLNTCFFGSADDTNYWESVSSFYKTSSYGNLNLSGIVGDFVYVDNNVNYYQAQISLNQKSVTDVTNSFLEQAYDQYFENGDLNYSDYDTDSDGYIDDMWLVYCTPYDATDSTSLLWAYTYWDSNLNYPHVKTYSWASYKFMYEGTETGVDAHTFIHETGHAMGLDDYYSYDSGNTREPLGKLDMMDYNILDHNALSKYNLGWITPTVAEYNNSYVLEPFQDSGDALILANNFNGTCFDEFLIITYYTPTGLNELDSTSYYSSYDVKGFDEPGIKVIHVDQRLGEFKYSSENNYFYWDGTYVDAPSDEPMEDSFYEIISSNTPSYCYDSEEFALASLVQASGRNNLMSKTSTDRTATNEDLFTPSSNQLGDTVFPYFTFDDGSFLPAKMEVTSLSSESASITFVAK